MIIKGDKNFKKNMKRLAQRFPEVRARTLNDMAFNARRLAQVNITREFILRNQKGIKDFTPRGVIVKKAGFRPGSVSIVGAVHKYLRHQELGKGALSIDHIPTEKARRGKSRLKRVASRKQINKIGTASIRRGTRRKAFISLMQARRAKSRKLFKFSFDGKEGLFQFQQSYKKDIVMMHRTDKKKVNIKPSRWLRPTLVPSVQFGPFLFKRNLRRFLTKI